MEQLRELAVRLAMGKALGDDLPMAAAEALARGIDSPALRELAGLSRGESREAVDLFRQAMEELGDRVPDVNGARLYLMRTAARDILAGIGQAEDLAHEIYCHACYADFPGRERLVDRFLVLSVEWDAMFADRAAAEAAIKEAAASFLREYPA